MTKKAARISLSDFAETIVPATLKSLTENRLDIRDWGGTVTVGFIFDPRDNREWGGFQPLTPSAIPDLPDASVIAAASTLSVPDHTAVVRAMVENSEDLLRVL
ncbi:MAG: hypothetical protein ACX939_10905, partial [Hyphococcus sp.]